MSFALVLFAPLVVLIPAAGAIETASGPVISVVDGPAAQLSARGEVPAGAFDPVVPGYPDDPLAGWAFRTVTQSFRIPAQNQVRVEQHMIIRISPQAPQRPMPPNVLLDLPRRDAGPRFAERSMGRCLPVSSITSVQPDIGSRLILFLRDRRMVSATLDRACRARDFYSGFYVERTPDGQLCVDRDTLLSRSGANCKLTRIRQLIDIDD